ncbi:hypothetical protein [Mycolicibacter sinensis]|uniref:Transmembrane protein n=1 Tax=Mycolicibacter sinensis (strain JDM601) TaxID=875328 RepID=A0A1A2NHT7_MYCSD|nr:hypothetical protein [Mycolicibacter sinensis]OBH14612.1 hypothetical protein A5694_11955 [Mycolicibacter sinensis]OBI32082.1 hypothetical protein A5710_16545 [Mycolicibacter sinensis]
MALPTLREIENANWDYLKTSAAAWRSLAHSWEAAFTQIRDAAARPGGTPWTGAGAEAFRHRTGVDVVTVHSPADILVNAADIAERGYDAQVANKGLVLSAVDAAERDDFRVGDDYSVADTWTYYTSAAEQEAREQAAQAPASFIKSRAVNLVVHEAEIGRNIATATAGLHGFSFPAEGADGGAGAADGRPHAVPLDDRWKSGSDRAANQREAFNKVYGRDPVSDNDWRMAAALDPHSYDPKYHGVPPEIVAGRITPQPGKGVVRSNMFIPTDQVQNVAKDPTDVAQGRYFPMNLGDNRGPSATADPEDSRVSVFVDYDHGTVVVRQNPTVNADGQRGGAAAAVPSVHVAQAADGRLTIDYDAHDAYENLVGTAMGISVNGRITFEPHPDGTVGLGGNTTIYPSMETYQYHNGAAPAELQWTPANSGSKYGPGTSLSRHHWIGDATIPAVRPDMPDWKWELENALPFAHDPFISHTTQLTDPFKGGIPTVGIGR